MKYTPSQIQKLFKDKNIVKDDKLQNLFKASDLDAKQQRDELLSFLGGKITYQQCDLLVDGFISAGVCAMYSLMESPVLNKKKTKVIDVDRAFFTFHKGVEAIKIFHDEKLFDETAYKFCESIKLNRVEAFDFLKKAINHSFSPLRYLPDNKMPDANEQPIFDALWLVNIIGSAREICGKTIEEITWQMNICQVFFYYLQFLKKNGHKGIMRKTNTQACWNRLQELMKAKIAEEEYRE